MTPNEKFLVRRLDQIVEEAKKDIKEHKEWLAEVKQRREERMEQLLNRK